MRSFDVTQLDAPLSQQHGQWVLEHVSPDGSTLPGSHGRLSTPGHAMEAGWFLLQEADTLSDEGGREREGGLVIT